MAAISGLYAATAGMALINANQQAAGLKAQAGFSSAMDEINAGMSDRAADDAVSRGETAASRARLKGKMVIGSQRAALAASGVDVNTGSAADVQADTAAMSALDAQTIKNNAAREALGYKTQALNFRTRAQMTRLGGDNAAGNTMLTGGMQFANYSAQALDWQRRGG